MIGALLCLTLVSWPNDVFAGEESEALPTWADLGGPPDRADRMIQKRKYELGAELTFMLGELPDSPFYKGLSATAEFALHFNNYIAWELASLTYVLDIDTDLKQQLIRIIQASQLPPPRLPEVVGMVASRIVLKPFYGKQALRDITLLHVEGYLGLGPALLLVQSQLKTNSLAAGADWTVGLRLWFTPVVSARLELGQVIYFVGGAFWQALHYQGGISFNIGGDE